MLLLKLKNPDKKNEIYLNKNKSGIMRIYRIYKRRKINPIVIKPPRLGIERVKKNYKYLDLNFQYALNKNYGKYS